MRSVSNAWGNLQKPTCLWIRLWNATMTHIWRSVCVYVGPWSYVVCCSGWIMSFLWPLVAFCVCVLCATTGVKPASDLFLVLKLTQWWNPRVFCGFSSFRLMHTNRWTNLSVIVSLSPLATPFITVLAFGVRTTWDTKNVPFLLQETQLFIYFCWVFFPWCCFAFYLFI